MQSIIQFFGEWDVKKYRRQDTCQILTNNGYSLDCEITIDPGMDIVG